MKRKEKYGYLYIALLLGLTLLVLAWAKSGRPEELGIFLFAAALLVIIGLIYYIHVLKRRNREEISAQESLYGAEDLRENTLTSVPLVYILVLDDAAVEINLTIEAEKSASGQDDFGLKEIVVQTLREFSESTGDKGVETLGDSSSEIPDYWLGDKTKLWRILERLWHNAAEYREKGRIMLTVSKIETHTAYAKLLAAEQLHKTLDRQDNQGLADQYRTFPKAKVLLCEDNSYNQDVAIGMLEVLGIRPVLAVNGQEALEKLEKEDFHLVFMDLMMPVLDGYEATVAIRESQAGYKDIPIIALTANVRQEEVDRCYAAGMNGHIGKPMDIRQVHTSLLEHLPEEIIQATDPQLMMRQTAPVEACKYPIIEGVDTRSGITRFGGNTDKYLHSLNQFAQTLGDELLTYQEAIKEVNAQHLILQIHTLKGVAGSLGLDELYQETIEFEKLLLADSVSEKVYHVLTETCHDTKQTLLNYFQDKGDKPKKVPVGGLGELKALLLALQESFDRGDIAACESLSEQVSLTRWEGIQALTLQKLMALVDEYDFEQTLQLLDSSLEGR